MYMHIKTFNHIIVKGGTVCKQACSSYTSKIIPEILLLINTTIFIIVWLKVGKSMKQKILTIPNYVYKTMMYSV